MVCIDKASHDKDGSCLAQYLADGAYYSSNKQDDREVIMLKKKTDGRRIASYAIPLSIAIFLLTILGGVPDTAFRPGSRCAGESALTIINSAYAYDTPIADFTANVTSGTQPLNVLFTNTSQGRITSHLWDFGDGTTSTGYGGHTYRIPGKYTVKLRVTGPDGTNTATKLDYIHVNYLPPVAKFTAKLTKGGKPLALAFTNASVGNVTSWLWDFGDGGSSAEKTPSHVYATAGVFTVKLKAAGPGGSNTQTRTDYITVYGPPVTGFTATPTGGIRPLEVSFSDTASGKITSRLWNFGDGKTGTGTNPVHTYYQAGTYTVSYTTTGPGGSDTVTKTNLITVRDPSPIADFKADVTSGGTPLQVTFTNKSSGPITSRLFDFGDGVTSSYGTHVYKNPGVFTVKLTVTGPGGSDTKVRTNYVSVYTPPVANFTADVRRGRSPLPVTFTDSSAGLVSSWQWDMGDGSTSSEQSPSHTYSTPGIYPVTLTVTGPGGTSAVTKTDYITVKLPLRSVNFIANFVLGASPRTVKFTDTSSGTPTSWLWDFGDGQPGSTEQNPRHTYNAKGTYRVTLTTDGPEGSASASNDITITYNNSTDIGSIDFSYNTSEATGLDPWSEPIPGIGPLSAVSVLRTNLLWGEFEPVEGQYYDGFTPKAGNPSQVYPLCNSLKSMFGSMYSDNMQVVLTLRGLSNTDSFFWPFAGANQVGVSHVPKDLQSVANAAYGYSREYYTFIRKVMETIDHWGYGPRFLGVVIENEMNSTENFSGSVDEYCRMAATARKAVKDVFPDKPVYCGGLQGAAAVWVLLDKYLKEGKVDEALDLYNGANPFDELMIDNDIDKLAAYTTAKMKTQQYSWLKNALASSLYGSGRVPAYDYLPLDGMNVHNYFENKVFEQVHEDLFKAHTKLPVVSNELGLVFRSKF